MGGILTGRQFGGPMINNSGGALALGDVVVYDLTSGDEYVTTTTTEGDPNVAGVVIEGEDDGERVRVAVADKVQVQADGAVAAGQWLKTSATVKKATPVASRDHFCFARALETTAGAGLVRAQMYLPTLGLELEHLDDHSVDAAEMQAMTDPGELGSESLATSGLGELLRVRWMLAEMSGERYWFQSPETNLLGDRIPRMRPGTL